MPWICISHPEGSWTIVWQKLLALKLEPNLRNLSVSAKKSPFLQRQSQRNWSPKFSWENQARDSFKIDWSTPVYLVLFFFLFDVPFTKKRFSSLEGRQRSNRMTWLWQNYVGFHSGICACKLLLDQAICKVNKFHLLERIATKWQYSGDASGAIYSMG